MNNFRMLVVSGVALLVALPALGKDPETDGPPLDFFVGDYVFVGREPDGGAAYSGSASIEPAEDGLVLKRRRDHQETIAKGRFEVPAPPGEGQVLRFRWNAPEPTIMTCLVGSDLDNYARLTCLWLREGSQPAEPGVEALFPTAAWPSHKP